jgi:hypothetical protein
MTTACPRPAGLMGFKVYQASVPGVAEDLGFRPISNGGSLAGHRFNTEEKTVRTFYIWPQATVCPKLAEADITAQKGDSGFDR